MRKSPTLRTFTLIVLNNFVCNFATGTVMVEIPFQAFSRRNATYLLSFFGVDLLPWFTEVSNHSAHCTNDDALTVYF